MEVNAPTIRECCRMGFRVFCLNVRYCRGQDGELRWLEAHARTIRHADGRVIGMMGSLDDITPRKVAELTLRNINMELEARVRARTADLEASNRELEAFSYSVSHDLRAPLRAIDGFSVILQEDLENSLDETARTYLKRIRTASANASSMLLAFAAWADS